MKRLLLILLLAMLLPLNVAAQVIQGVVTDASTKETLPGVHVYFQDNTKAVVRTDAYGRYKIAARKGMLVFSMMGYNTQILEVKGAMKLNVKLVESESSLKEVEVKSKKKRYVRKDNPAVQLIQKVIDAKKKGDIHLHDYSSFTKYEKMVTALNEFTPKVFEDDHFKRMPFLKDHVEKCTETGKLILPLIVDEKVSEIIYRKDPKADKTIVVGQRTEGINEFVSTGDMMNALLADCFTDVDIYEDNIRLLKFPFLSPIASNGALGFYRYYLADTLMVDNESCIQVDFTPNNPQDFGFSGSLWITNDSTYRVKRSHLGIPSRSDVNFVEQMDIIQDFTLLPTGEQVMTDNKMIIQLALTSWFQKAQVERTIKYSNYSFDVIPDKKFKFLGDVKVESSSMMKDENFWKENRPAPLSNSEGRMAQLLHSIENIKGFKPILWILKAFIENHVETSVNPDRPSLIDIGPVNTTIGSNWVEGFKLRLSGQTTANLNKHWFLKGYGSYGFGDKRWKGMGELTYSFNEKDFLPREYPCHNITFTYTNDVISPSDKFLSTDKDNVFVALKWAKVRHMNYFERFNLLYDKEWENGLRLNAQLRREWNEGAGDLFYQPLSAGTITETGLMPTNDVNASLKKITFTEAKLSLQFQPGASYANTKQRRIQTNHDTPIMSISHTMGFKALGGQYKYNYTEATLYKRFWLRTWGRIDCTAQAGIMWNKVPFPFLIMPAANLSYITQNNTFCLINNMEFLNDRYASLHLTWDLNGKLFNRIPLLRELKWRECFSVNMLWGTLTSKNNPFLERNQGDNTLFFFPGSYVHDGSFEYASHVMQRNKPYIEVVAGIHNIFRFLQIEYVHRLNYVSGEYGKVHNWGIRGRLNFSF